MARPSAVADHDLVDHAGGSSRSITLTVSIYRRTRQPLSAVKAIFRQGVTSTL
jgi:hypothetical protein